jgi:hypothetical protein
VINLPIEIIGVAEVNKYSSFHRPPGPAGFNFWLGYRGMAFIPRWEVAQKMELTEVGEKMVKFTAITEGSMTVLEYRRPTDTTFTIGTGRGEPFTLQAQ